MTTPAAPLNNQLAQLSSELDECSLRVERLVEHAGDKLWTPPPSGGWAVGQCIAHLTRTSQESVPKLEEALSNAPTGLPPYKPTLTGRLLAWFLEPPYRMKSKAAPRFTPRDRRLTGPELIGEFLSSQQEIQRALNLANGKAIDRIIQPSAVNARVKYDLYSAFRIIAAHERRHLWQAERVLSLLAAR
jgi:hypothetical protein